MKATENTRISNNTENEASRAHREFSGPDYVNFEEPSPPALPQKQRLPSPTFPSPSLPPKLWLGQTNGLKPLIPPKPKNVSPPTRKVSTGTQVTLVKKSSFKSQKPNRNSDAKTIREEPVNEIFQSKTSAASPSLSRAHKPEDDILACIPKESVVSLREKFESQNCTQKQTIIKEEEKIYIKKIKVRKSIHTIIKPFVCPKPSPNPKPILKNTNNANGTNSVSFASDCEFNNLSPKRIVVTKNGIVRSNSLPSSRNESKYGSKLTRKPSTNRDSRNNRRNAYVYNTVELAGAETIKNNNKNTILNNGSPSLWNWDAGNDIDIEDHSSKPLGAIVFSGWKKSKTFPVILNRRPPTIVSLPSPTQTKNGPFSYLKPNPDFISIKTLKTQQLNSQHPSTAIPAKTKVAEATVENNKSTTNKVPVPPPRLRRKSLILFPPDFNLFSLVNDTNEVENENPDAVHVKDCVKLIDSQDKLIESKKPKPKAPDPPLEILLTPTLSSVPTETETETKSAEPERVPENDERKPSQSLIPPKSPHIYAKVNHNRKTGGSCNKSIRNKFIKNNSRYNKNDNIEKTSLLADTLVPICFETDDLIDFKPVPLPPSPPPNNQLTSEHDRENEYENKDLAKNARNNKIKLNPICEHEYEIIEDLKPVPLTDLSAAIDLPVMAGLKKPGCFESTFKAQYLNTINKNKDSNCNLKPSQIVALERLEKSKEKHCPNEIDNEFKPAPVPAPVLPLSEPEPVVAVPTQTLVVVIPDIKNEEKEIDMGNKAIGDAKEISESMTVSPIQELELPSNTSFLFTCMHTPIVATNENPFLFSHESASAPTLEDLCEANNEDIIDANKDDKNEGVATVLEVGETVTDGADSRLTHEMDTKTVTESESGTPSIIAINPTAVKENDREITEVPEIAEIPQVLVSDCDMETPDDLTPHSDLEKFQEISLVCEMTHFMDKLNLENKNQSNDDSNDETIIESDHENEKTLLLENTRRTENGTVAELQFKDEVSSNGNECGSGSGSEEGKEIKVLPMTPKSKHNSGILEFVDKEIQKVQSLLAEFCPNSNSNPAATSASSTSLPTSISNSKPPETPKHAKRPKATKTKSLALDIPKSVLLRKSSVPELFVNATTIALSSAVSTGDNRSDVDDQNKLFRRSWATKSNSSVGSTTSSSSTGSKNTTNSSNKSTVDPTAGTGSGTGSSKSLSLLGGSTQNISRHFKGRRLSDVSQISQIWDDEGETSTGAIGDNEHSPLHSSNEEMGSMESGSTGHGHNHSRSVFRRRKTVAHFFDKARKPSLASWWRPSHNSNSHTSQIENSCNTNKHINPKMGRKNSVFHVHEGDNSSIGSGSTDGGTRRLSSDEDSRAVENEQFEEKESKKRQEAEVLNEIMSHLSPKAKKAFYVVREILTSEKTFVDVLRLLTIDFPKSLKKSGKKAKGGEVISQQDLDYILGGLPILKGVNEDLLHDLEERISHWEEHSKISDIFVKKGAFLKHYTYYIKDFEKLSRFFDSQCATNGPFASAVKDFELKRNCHNLGLKPFMLKPVQRMPQYSLLLEDYLKNLDDDHVDYEDTVKAIGIVRSVAEHANEAIRIQMTWERLLKLQARLPGVDILGEDKQLIKDGELLKVCRKELQPRYFALMNDALLCMAYHNSSSKELKVKYKLPLTRMKIMLNSNGEHQFEFSIIGVARSFIVVAKSAKERDEWIDALKATVNEHMKRRPSFIPSIDTAEKTYMLGKQAPVWVQDSRTSMCQICTFEFSIVFRRHHCRACGKVVCRHCSANEAPLKYLDYDACRVCDSCYDVLLNEYEEEHVDKDSAEFRQNRLKFKKFNMNAIATTKKVTSEKKPLTKKTIKLPLKSQINKGSDAVTKLKGYLQWKEKRVWKRNWFVLIDCILYVFAASEDVAAIQTIPVLGYTVDKGGEEDGADEDLSFKLIHKGRGAILFQAESCQLARKWMEALNGVTTLQDL